MVYAAHFFVWGEFMQNCEDNWVYRIDGNQGRVLKVYEDRCVIEPSPVYEGKIKECGGFSELFYSEISAMRFRNVTFFMSGFLRFESRGEVDWFFFTGFSKTVRDRLFVQMPEVYDYISGRIDETNKK